MKNNEIDDYWKEAQNLTRNNSKKEALLIYKELAKNNVFGSHVAAASLLEELMPQNWQKEAYTLLRRAIRTKDPEALLMISRLALFEGEPFCMIEFNRAFKILLCLGECAPSKTIRAIAYFILGEYFEKNKISSHAKIEEYSPEIFFRMAAKNGSIPALYHLAKIMGAKNHRIMALLYGLRWAMLVSLAEYVSSMRFRLMEK